MTSVFELQVRDIAMDTSRVEALRKRVDRHKYDHGHGLILSGGAGQSGAARLAGRAALRIGAGLVTIGVPRDALAEVAAQVTAIMVRVADPLGDLLADPRLNAICIGPGYGVGQSCRRAVSTVLAQDRAVVLDADALTSFAGDGDALFEQSFGRAVVMTPHRGEFARLFPDLPADRSGVASAADRAGCVVLLKGQCTRIGVGRGFVSEHNLRGHRAAPWLATAGSGDVLAGMVTGLLARGLAPADAAEAAVWIHAECARVFGPGLIAEDLADQVPMVLRDLGV